MRTRYSIFVIVVLLALATGFLFAGCGRADSLVGGRADSANPEGVFNAFWDAYSKGDFEGAARYVASDIRADLDEYVSEVAENPFAKDFFTFLLDKIKVSTAGYSIDGNEATVRLKVSAPDFETLFEDNEEALGMIFGLAFFTMADPEELSDEDVATWKEMLDELDKMIKQAETITQEETVTMIKEDGQWKVSDIPNLDFF